MILWHKLWRDEWLKLLIFTLFMGIVAVLQATLWPMFSRFIPAVKELVPDAFKGFMSGMVEEGFIYFTLTQQLIKNVGVFGSALALLLGASAIAREIEAGTMELLLAQPISRARVITEKYLFGCGVLAVPVILSTFLTWPGGLLVGETIDPAALMVSGVYCYLVVLTLFSLALLAGTWLADQMQVISIGIGVALVMTILSLFKETKFFSLYGWIDPEMLRPILVLGYLPWKEMALFAAVNGLIFALARRRFLRMNI